MIITAGMAWGGDGASGGLGVTPGFPAALGGGSATEDLGTRAGRVANGCSVSAWAARIAVSRCSAQLPIGELTVVGSEAAFRHGGLLTRRFDLLNHFSSIPSLCLWGYERRKRSGARRALTSLSKERENSTTGIGSPYQPRKTIFFRDALSGSRAIPHPSRHWIPNAPLSAMFTSRRPAWTAGCRGRPGILPGWQD